jgi:ferredoxin
VNNVIIFENNEIELNNSLTILDNLEAKKIKVPYQCREGYCGACCMKLISGDIEYLQEPMAFCDEDEILPCICKAKTDIVIKRI